LILAFLVIIAGVFTLGVAMPTLTASDFSRLGFSHREVMFLCMADLGLTFMVIAMLAWLLLRLTGAQLGSPRVVEVAPRDILQPQISAPPQSVGSVTENTTRTLDQRRYDTPRSLG
jgi:cytosine/uracil/thiamine/allantoin permease